jgi:CheY-like chemotaxis protein
LHNPVFASKYEFFRSGTTGAVSECEPIRDNLSYMRILLVEDHQDTRQVLARLLTHWGFDVAAAENLKSGLAHLDGPPFDVILSDIGLPDGTGHALVSEARRRGKNILAIALSGFGHPSEVQLAKLTGFDHHLCKPCDCQQLRTLLAGKMPGSAAEPDTSLGQPTA